MKLSVLATTAAALLLVVPAGAFAHGGQYQPPPTPEPPGPGRIPVPQGPGAPIGPGGPSTPGGPGKGPTTPGPGGPTSPGGPLTGGTPKPRRAPGTLSLDHWTRWWYANRTHVITLHARAGSKGVVTPGGSSRPQAELWREEAKVALLAALENRDEDIASGAAIALGKAADPETASQLRALLLNRKRQQPVREAAALALGLLGIEKSADEARQTRRALESVAAGRKSPSRLRAMAVYALGLRQEPGSLPFLLDVAHSGGASWDVPAAGTSALGLSGSDMTREDLLAMLRGTKRTRRKETVARVYAAHGLARTGDPAALPALRKAATGKDEQVRRAAVLALGAIAKADDADTAKILQWVINRDKDAPCRNMAALSIGRIGDPTAEHTLRYWFKKGDGRHQPFAALGLGLLARKKKDAGIARLLTKELERRANADLRGALSIAIGLSGAMDSAPVLRELAADRGNPDVRAHAAVALGLLGDRQEAAPILRELLLKKGNPMLQREVALALGLLGDRESIRTLVKLIRSDEGIYVQGSAAVALGRIGGGESARVLIDLLQDDDNSLLARSMGAVGLGLLLDRTEGRSLHRVGADLNWYLLTPTVQEILDIL